mmetsp:Transcript_11502/g.28974  ORF Transcript_11502/g.28974 Transcript_11502/m.28974 type:complete len:589 (+) Transcript_11502:25-1791(+)|eukprot:CAMPEP_0177655436 /NCGR_PEP_ID=MMETSP0447-20121125/14969_1 /TAXON_ID=0 /ORGANISM="Stygamoeba regulata, Strain BSH-02190019" /LENGTH=588 /DNA_ID=CAMNT_0019159361 /DNA_START=23 /DNA_END=1789 /DNA_ORIENTATION=-
MQVSVLLALVCIVAATTGATYTEGEPVYLFMSKISPYSNPSETYKYYSLPFCPPSNSTSATTHKLSLEESFKGDVMTNSAIEIGFNTPVAWKELCTQHLTVKDVEMFRKAIRKYYYFEMYLDGMPLRGFVGSVDKNEEGEAVKFYLFKHLHFTVLYNENRVIYANVTADLRQVAELPEPESLGSEEFSVEFSYSVQWVPTDHPYSRRAELLLSDQFFEQEMEVHWLSILNSIVLVILLTGFIAIIIMRVLKSDFSRYSRAEDLEDDEDDYGWKLLHGDVFRFPQHRMLFSSFFGIGCQFLLVCFSVLTLSLAGFFNTANKQGMITTIIAVYNLSFFFGGAVSAGMYKKLDGARWAWNIVLTATVFFLPFFVLTVLLCIVATTYSSSSALPVSSLYKLFAIWLFVGFPLTLLGGIAGKRLAGPFEASTRTKNFPREIPPLPWYRQPIVQYSMAGFLPFSAIYIELYYIFTSVWGHNSYHLYGILFIVFLILLAVTACITIALTYFQLSMEDHRWWWRSFISGGSTGVFIYLYSFFYYFYRSHMSGLLQASFYFGFTLMFCYFFFLMLGTVGFYCSLVFVRRIYTNCKCE